MTPAIEIVQAWQAAVNAQDAEALLEHSAPDIALVGPRGRATGHAVLRAWLERAGVTLTTQRIFARGNTMVLAQQGTWQSAATGGVPSTAQVASRFQVAQGRITEYERYDDVHDALAASGLTEADAQIAV